MNIVMFTFSSGGIAEDLNKRKPIKVIGNPRRKYYTRKCIIDDLSKINNARCRILQDVVLFHKWTGAMRRKYAHLKNRSRALAYASRLKDA